MSEELPMGEVVNLSDYRPKREERSTSSTLDVADACDTTTFTITLNGMKVDVSTSADENGLPVGLIFLPNGDCED